MKSHLLFGNYNLIYRYIGFINKRYRFDFSKLSSNDEKKSASIAFFVVSPLTFDRFKLFIATMLFAGGNN